MKKCSVLLLMLLFPLGVLAQSVTVSGQVTDEAGEPIIGASVRIPGTSVGVVTDMEAITQSLFRKENNSKSLMWVTRRK